jgi:hypothetical protein
MIGGGALTTMVKHSRIDDARAAAHVVQQALRRFQRELADVDERTTIVAELGSFETFADYFFDGLIADWIVQSKIERSLAQSTDMRDRVRLAVRALRRRLEANQRQIDEITRQRQQLIERA